MERERERVERGEKGRGEGSRQREKARREERGRVSHLLLPYQFADYALSSLLLRYDSPHHRREEEMRGREGVANRSREGSGQQERRERESGTVVRE